MKKLVFSLLIAFVIISCNKSDDNTPVPIELSGKWELKRVSCFCFFPEDFDFTVHKIDFNTAERVSIIENSDESLFIAPAGSYNFQVQADTIIIDDTIKYIYTVNGNDLTLTFKDNPELADDEISLFYKKL